MFNAILKIFGLGGDSGSKRSAASVSPGKGGMKDLEKFVDFVARSLVDYPDEIRVATEVGEERTTIKIHCRKEDNGKIIGKRGKTISAIRSLVSGAAGRLQQKVNVEVVD